MRTRWVVSITFAAVAAVVGAANLDLELNPVRTRPAASATSDQQQIIVKLRSDRVSTAAVGRARIQAVDLGAGQTRVTALIQRAGLTLRDHRAITADVHVIHVDPATAGEPIERTLARLRADADVEYAEPDQRRYIHATPTDPLYASLQWYLQPNAPALPAAIDAQTAWNTTTGGNLVIADIDTGVRADHPDLTGRLLNGYCFISDSFVANGGICPGASSLDTGDWITSSDVSNHSECKGASVSVSSWHGTRTAGILGATANNGIGIAGLTWGPQTQILPVRALGKCGGADSDIITGMLWAAGIQVNVNGSVLTNANPAKVINMSIGGTGACPMSYQDAIRQVNVLGVVVVVSAGNEGGPVDAPANCPGAIAVAGLRHAGTKVGYSSLGPQVALGAPAGNCGSTSAGAPCQYSITTTTNLGETNPDTNDYTGLYYCNSTAALDPTGTVTPSSPNCVINNTNQYRTYNLGTSFSAPVVSGIAALMASANANLNSCQILARLKEGALPYPQSSVGAATAPPMCHVPQNSSDLQQAECICTLDGKTCGTGMANARGAMNAALRPIAGVNAPASVVAGQTAQLQGSGAAAAGRSVTTYSWAQTSGPSLALQGASSATATVTPPACGLATATLTVTDNMGLQDTATVVISPTAITTTAPTTAGALACSTAAAAIQVAVCPGSANVQADIGTQSFTSSVANASTGNVTWEVNGVAGGNSVTGSISQSGVYTAPGAVPTPAIVTITAVSAADGVTSGAAQVTVTAPVSVSISPAAPSVPAGTTQSFSASVKNTANTAVSWNVNGVGGGNATIGTISSTGMYTAPAAVPSPATVTVGAVSAADPNESGSTQVTVTAAPPMSSGSGGGTGGSGSKSGGGAIDPATLLMLAGALLALARRPLRARRT
jgi:serine protease